MNFIKKLILLLLSALVFQNCSSDKDANQQGELIEASVSDPTGLSVFDTTSYQSRRIIKLAYREKLTLLEDTQKPDEVSGVKGSWFKVRYKNIEGYAFSGFFEVNAEANTSTNNYNNTDGLSRGPQENPLLEKIKGRIFSGGVGSGVLSPCEGILYTAAGEDVVFSDNNAVKVYVFNHGMCALYYGTYTINGNNFIVNLTEASEIRAPFGPETGETKIIPRHATNEQLIYKFDFNECPNQTSFTGGFSPNEKLVFVEPSLELRDKIRNWMVRHEYEINNANTYQSTKGKYISYEEGGEEKIVLSTVGSRYAIRYYSDKYKQGIDLNIYNTNISRGTCDVSFPSAPNVRYKMAFYGSGGATCTYPNGRVQKFWRE